MTTLDFDTIAQRLGEQVAVSDWIAVDQARIDRFAVATGDDQWIHVDPARAAASPFGGTIAHGFLTLALLTPMLRSALSVPAHLVVNYGLNRARFTAPVPSGARVRGRFSPAAVARRGATVDVVWQVTVDLEHSRTPCAVVEWILRYHPTSFEVDSGRTS
jgi:acyl dehydratase